MHSLQNTFEAAINIGQFAFAWIIFITGAKKRKKETENISFNFSGMGEYSGKDGDRSPFKNGVDGTIISIPAPSPPKKKKKEEEVYVCYVHFVHDIVI